MKSTQNRHRRWLDEQMPNATEAADHLEQTLLAVSRPRKFLWPTLALATTAVVAAIIVAVDPGPASELPPPSTSPIAWNISLALHVSGQSPSTDVEIRIATRRKQAP